MLRTRITPTRRPVAGDIVIDRLGTEYLVLAGGLRYIRSQRVDNKEGALLRVMDVQIKPVMPPAPVESKSEEFTK